MMKKSNVNAVMPGTDSFESKLLSDSVLVKALSKEQTLLVVSMLVDNIKKEYGVSNDEILSVLSHGIPKYEIPIDIFSGDLSPAESLVKYMKENLQLKYCDIAKELNRDERGIWSTYNIVSKKMPVLFMPKSDVFIPVTLFSNRNHSVLEVLIMYLKTERRFELKRIAKELGKAESTIYTIYRRARIKDEIL